MNNALVPFTALEPGSRIAGARIREITFGYLQSEHIRDQHNDLRAIVHHGAELALVLEEVEEWFLNGLTDAYHKGRDFSLGDTGPIWRITKLDITMGYDGEVQVNTTLETVQQWILRV